MQNNKNIFKKLLLFSILIGLVSILAVVAILFLSPFTAPPVIMYYFFKLGFLSTILAIALSIVGMKKQKIKTNVDYFMVIISLVGFVVLSFMFVIIPNLYPYE